LSRRHARFTLLYARKQRFPCDRLPLDHGFPSPTFNHLPKNVLIWRMSLRFSEMPRQIKAARRCCMDIVS
jgi:hypothetical protein